MNKQIRVGFLFIFFLVIFLLFAFWIKGNPFQKTKTLHVLFENVHGVSKGSRIEYAGLECGKVKGFEVTPRGVLTTLLITNSQVKIYEGDQFFISPSSTIASEYQIFIIPNTAPSIEVPDEATILGQSPPGIQDFLFEAEKTLDQIQNILGGIDKSITHLKPVFEKVGQLAKDGTIDRMANDLSQSTKAIKELTTSTNSILKRNNTKIQNTVDNLAESSQKANDKLSAINSEDINQTIYSLKNASHNIEAITRAVKPEQVSNDLKKFSSAAEQIKQIGDKLQSPNPEEDVPNLIKNTVQRMDLITRSLTSSLQGKTLFRGFLFTKMNFPEKIPNKKVKLNKKVELNSSKQENYTKQENELKTENEIEEKEKIND